jgi:transposase
MNRRRLVGIDLGIATAHTVRGLDGEGAVVAKRRAWPAAESLMAVEAAALAGCPEGTRLEVVIEPTGPAWLPIAVFFSARGHRVFRVSSQKAADLRRFLSRHAKSNGVDADTLARLPLFGPAGLRPLVLPGAERAALDRRVRATDRLTRAAADHKRRIKDLARQLLPMTPLTGDLGAADLAVLERYADPRALARAGQSELAEVIATASHGQQGAGRARQWLDAARASLELYAGHPAVDFAGLAAEIATEARLLRAVQAELGAHAAHRETCYQAVDPAGLARSLPGLAQVGGPALTACMGDPARFGRGKQFRSYTGLAPKASETGETDRKGQPMSKAGSSLLRTTLVRAADTARKQDPQLAAIYYQQMTQRGKGHLGALCVTAASLAERAWTVMRRATPYVICDTDGRPVTPDQAKAIINERWTVQPEVRARRRSKKTGKAPHKVLEGQCTRGSLRESEDRDVHVVVVVGGDAAAVGHLHPPGRRHPGVPDPLPVDDVHDPQPGGVGLRPGGDVVTAPDAGPGRHDPAGAQHEVAGPAERMLAGGLRPVAADRAERAEPAVDLVLHLPHAGSDGVADHRGLGPEPGQQRLDPVALARQLREQPAQGGRPGAGGPLGPLLGQQELLQCPFLGAALPGDVLEVR